MRQGHPGMIATPCRVVLGHWLLTILPAVHDTDSAFSGTRITVKSHDFFSIFVFYFPRSGSTRLRRRGFRFGFRNAIGNSCRAATNSNEISKRFFRRFSYSANKSRFSSFSTVRDDGAYINGNISSGRNDILPGRAMETGRTNNR